MQFQNSGFTPWFMSSEVITSCGIELNAFWISNLSKTRFLCLICSTFDRQRIYALFLKANWFLFSLTCPLSCYVSILWNTSNIVSDRAIGLKSFSFFARNTDLNSNRFGIALTRSGLLMIALNMITSLCTRIGLDTARYLRCLGPIPNEPELLPIFRCEMVSKTFYSSMLSGAYQLILWTLVSFIETGRGSGYFLLISSTICSSLICTLR